MNIRKLSAVIAAAASVATAAGETTEIGQVAKCSVYASGATLSVGMDEALDPSTIEAPAFWLDASDTSGWTIADGKVTRIPSKSSQRYLTWEKPELWNGWNGVEFTAPEFTSCDSESGLPCVDFGNRGSGRALMFDGGAMENIGTVIAVFNACDWGGWLFGGKFTNEGIWNYHRGSFFNSEYYTNIFDYRNPLASSKSSLAITTSVFRQNGLPYIPVSVGWGGGWEVYSLNPANATKLSASGIGFNDLSANKGDISGGMKYAELLIYDRLLDIETVAKIERFLARKWGLGKRMFGGNGKSHIDVLYVNQTKSFGMQVELNVPENCELSISDIRAGHNGDLVQEAKLIKTGNGGLTIGDFSRYTGKLELCSGNLSLNTETVDSAADNFVMPDGVVCRFDMSRRDTMDTTTENGVEYLNRINDADGRFFYGDAAKVLNLRSRGVLEVGGDQRPWLSDEYVTPTGIRMLDTGNWVGDTGSSQTQYSRGFDLYVGDSSGGFGALTTIIAAIGAQRGGGWLADGAFQRAKQSSQISVGLLNGDLSLANGLSPTNGTAYVDGIRIEKPGTVGYPDNGWHVVCLQVPGSAPGHIGEYFKKAGGGLILGEFLAWNRPLTEDEILEVQNHLSLKWFGKAIRMTSGRTDDVPVLQKLAVAGESSVTVGEGSAHIGTLEVNAPLVKKGPGTLYVQNIVNQKKYPITIESGKITLAAAPALTQEGIAAAPSVRVDLTDTNGWEIVEQNGEKFVKSLPVNGDASVKIFQSASASYPKIRDDAGFIAKESVPVLDFGEFVARPSPKSRYLAFDKNLESVRSVYVVWRLKPGSKSVLLGSSGLTAAEGGVGDPNVGTVHLNLYRCDFLRGQQETGVPTLWNQFSNTALAIRNGETYTNGVKIAAENIKQIYPLEDEWQLVEAHTVAGVHASAIGGDRDNEGSGGMALAEVIVYERELSEREKVATRNYLLKKWFGKTDAELAPVPEAGVQPLELPVLSVDGSAEIADANVKTLAGKGTLVKTGDGELSILNVGSFTGSVAVAEGSVRFTGQYRAEPKMATEGLRLRLAADEGLTLIDNADGTRGVLEWKSSVEDGWKAVAPTGYVIKAGESKNLSKHAPLYIENSQLNSLPVVDMPKFRCFRFIDPDGNYASVKDIRNVFWVIGSERGGGWMLGGGNLDSSNFNAKYIAWHRGANDNDANSSGTAHIDAIINGSAYFGVYDSSYSLWRKNSEVISGRQDSLSGSWDQLTYSAKPTIASAAKEYPAASGLAFDGRIFDGNEVNVAYGDRAGNQTLAEVLIYTNDLSEAEILQTEAYLNCKWGLNNAVSTMQENIRLDVAAGASVEFEGGVGAFAAIEGAGTVNGDVSAKELTADFLKSGFLTVNGTFSLADGQKITFRNLPQELPAEVKLLQAEEIEGEEFRRNIVVAGVEEGKVKVKLSVRGGALYARVNDYNMVIIVR